MTIAGPWPLSVRLPLQPLRELATSIHGTRFTLSTVGLLGDATCLFPENDDALLRARASILEAVGVADEVDEEWHIHLTVCRGANERTLARVEEEISKALPLHCKARGLLLAQMLSDSEVTVRPL
jgi:2'-5' RNA ligase superfamily